MGFFDEVACKKCGSWYWSSSCSEKGKNLCGDCCKKHLKKKRKKREKIAFEREQEQRRAIERERVRGILQSEIDNFKESSIESIEKSYSIMIDFNKENVLILNRRFDSAVKSIENELSEISQLISTLQKEQFNLQRI